MECREVFQQANDFLAVGGTLSALAYIESARGHGDSAIGLARDSLRYLYSTGAAIKIMTAHNILAELLLRDSQQPADAIAHYLAAGLIHHVAGGVFPESLVSSISFAIRVSADAARLPDDLTELCGEVARVPGAELMLLLTGLSSDQRMIDLAFRELIDRVRGGDPEAPNWAPFLAFFDPWIAALVAADRGDDRAGDAFDYFVAQYPPPEEWAEVVNVLTLIRSGQRGAELTDGINMLHAAVVRRALDALAGKVTIPVALWHALPLGRLLLSIVASQFGDTIQARSAREQLTLLKQAPGWEELVLALEKVLSGDYAPSVSDPVNQAVVATVLNHIPRR